MAKIVIPTALRAYTDSHDTIEVPSVRTVGEAIQRLVEQFPKLRTHLYTEEGRLRSFVNLYLGDEDVRYLNGEDTPLQEGDELIIVPSIAGGSPLVEPSQVSPQLSVIPEERLVGIELSQEEVLRYSRHLIMPEVTLEG
ncbi:MAG: MoaD/ThiS family protein, partial [candidate division WOR-3 bacterium]